MTWTYVLTAAAMIAVPGPDVLLLTGRTVHHGLATGLRTLAGIVVGYLALTAVVATGLGGVLAARPSLLTALRWFAVGYLLLLAVQSWRSRDRQAQPAEPFPDDRHQRIGRDSVVGFLTATLNPKGLLFFLALLPPFVAPDRPRLPQLLVLGLTFCALLVPIYGGAVLVAALAHRRAAGSTRRASTASAVVLTAAAAVVASGGGR
ncbi:MAG: LysE family translocator [Dermatophilaceae bacterium]